MENFVEYSLPYRLTLLDWAKRLAATAALLFVGGFAVLYLGAIGLAVCAVLCYVAYRVFISFNYEWEYSLVEDEVHFTKIINKERRREVLKADLGKTVCYGPVEHLPAQTGSRRSFVSNGGELPVYYWVTEKKNGEKVCILFQPDERILGVFAVRARGKLQ